jgi:CubicO group peptidase (beta-lactamase class C family)
MKAFASLALTLALVPLLSARLDSLDDYVRAQMTRFDLPGAAVAIVKNGRVVKRAGYGVADIEHRVATTPDSVYKIGSVSKQFIATAIMLLAADGRLKVDDHLATYIRDVPESWRSITLRHLLTHTAGLVRESPAFDPMSAKPDRDVLHGAYAVPLLFAPGDKWAYSNTGYYALAVVISEVSGRPWPQFIQELVFGPAGMTFTVPTNAPRAPQPRAVGYTGRNNTRPADDWGALRPSGAFFSTLDDLVKWDVLLDGDTILNATQRQEMWTPVRLNDGTTYPYGYGWHAESRDGRRMIWHGGGLPGYSSYFGRFLDDHLTVIVLANGDDADLVAMGHGLAQAYFAQSPR